MVETDSAGGSGLLLDSNTILTAAHVLYPHRSARIVFSDGTELLEVPVIGWDLLTDVAVLGPVQLDSPPALPPFDTSNALPVGAELFTIGYPGEVEPFPQPTISRGILSRYRRWPEQAVTYLQTDAAVNEGQSGGVLVSAAGTVFPASRRFQTVPSRIAAARLELMRGGRQRRAPPTAGGG